MTEYFGGMGGGSGGGGGERAASASSSATSGNNFGGFASDGSQVASIIALGAVALAVFGFLVLIFIARKS
jgi:hypothetical protein